MWQTLEGHHLNQQTSDHLNSLSCLNQITGQQENLVNKEMQDPLETKTISWDPTLYLIYWKQLLKWMEYYTTIRYLLTYILIQGLYHGTRSEKIWIYYMYQSKHTRQKSLQKRMKFWKSRLARLNNMFDSYFKENYKLVDYHVKTPSMREHNLTWRPYGYYKRRRSKIACSKCIAIKTTTIIEARSAMEGERKIRMEFDLDSFDILIDNFCCHTLKSDINDYIEPPLKSSVRVKGYNGSTNSTMVGTVKWKIKDDNGKVHFHITKHILFIFS